MAHYLSSQLFIFFIFLFRATPTVYEGSQARGVQLEPQLQAYARATAPRATATPDPSHIGDLHHSSWQCRILNPLREARDQTHVLMDPSQVR